MNEALRKIPEGIGRFQSRALTLGIVGGVATAAAGLAWPAAFFRSYLVAYLFWLGISLGCLAILMIQHLSGGSWAIVIRRLLESGARTLPLMALLFVPILLGMHHLYEWTHADVVQKDPILLHKAAYLNVPFFVFRAAVYFGVWLALTLLLSRWSVRQDGGSEPTVTRRMQVLSGPGLVLFVLTVTFASVDWVMSLEPHWYSTIYGALFMAGQALGALSFAIAAAVLLSRSEPLRSAISATHLHDLGKLLLAFVMVWAYFAFSQFLIVWAGNLPEEIPWYLKRFVGGWKWLALSLALGQFVLPFVLLLSRQVKRDSRILSRVAVFVVVLRLVDLAWLVLPAFEHAGGASTALLVVAASVGVGGIWLAFFSRQLRQQPLLPLGDPQLEEALAHGRH